MDMTSHIAVSTKAYVSLFMHCARHPDSIVIGFIIGNKTSLGEVIYVESALTSFAVKIYLLYLLYEIRLLLKIFFQ